MGTPISTSSSMLLLAVVSMRLRLPDKFCLLPSGRLAEGESHLSGALRLLEFEDKAEMDCVAAAGMAAALAEARGAAEGTVTVVLGGWLVAAAGRLPEGTLC